MSIAAYLSALVSQKNALAENLVSKGVSASASETLTTLVPKVLQIPSGSSATLVSKRITYNGNFDPARDNADGYSSVSVNVPNSYSESDEDKIVANGMLIEQTPMESEITENGLYITIGCSSVVVNVPSVWHSPRTDAPVNFEMYALPMSWVTTAVKEE